MKRVVSNKRAFTLIELLVVVLIIGILAAVAVPQYQKAVEKARLSEAFVGLKAIAQASDLYYLANGTRPYDFTLLDIDFPIKEYRTYEGIENSFIVLNNGTIYYLDIDGYVQGSVPGVSARLEYMWDRKKYWCRVYATTDTPHRGHELCQALGGVFVKEGSDFAATFYQLP